MKVRMMSEISGLRDGAPWPKRGEEIDVPDEEGAVLCGQRHAEPVADTDPEKRPAAKRAEKRA